MKTINLQKYITPFFVVLLLITFTSGCKSKSPQEKAKDKLEMEAKQSNITLNDLGDPNGETFQEGRMEYDREQNALRFVAKFNRSTSEQIEVVLKIAEAKQAMIQEMEQALTVSTFKGDSSIQDAIKELIDAQASLQIRYVTSSNTLIYEKTFPWTAFK